MNKQRWARVSRALDEALAYLMADAWPTRETDTTIAELIYTKWIADTDAQWQASGYRDREQLLEELDEVFTKRCGAEGGRARIILLALELECRSRETGKTRASGEQ